MKIKKTNQNHTSHSVLTIFLPQYELLKNLRGVEGVRTKNFRVCSRRENGIYLKSVNSRTRMVRLEFIKNGQRQPFEIYAKKGEFEIAQDSLEIFLEEQDY